MNNGVWVIALYVTAESEFQAAYTAYAGGAYLGMDVYALPKSKLPECQDTGEVMIQDLDKILEEHPPRAEYRF